GSRGGRGRAALSGGWKPPRVGRLLGGPPAVAQSLYGHATEFAPDAVHHIVRGRLARKLSYRGLGRPAGPCARLRVHRRNRLASCDLLARPSRTVRSLESRGVILHAAKTWTFGIRPQV